MAGLSTLQSGPKGTEMVKLSVFDHLGPFWAHMNTFGPFQTKIKLLPYKDKVRFYRGAFEQKNHFFVLNGSKGPRRAQNRSQMAKNN